MSFSISFSMWVSFAYSFSFYVYVLRGTCRWYVYLLPFTFTFAFYGSVHFDVLRFDSTSYVLGRLRVTFYALCWETRRRTVEAYEKETTQDASPRDAEVVFACYVLRLNLCLRFTCPFTF